MTEEDFRTALRDGLGPAMDELSAPDVLSGVRARQVRHQRSVRAGLAVSAAATVATVVAAVALWPQSELAGPTAPASLSSPVVPPTSAGLTSPAPSPSTAIVSLKGLPPLVTTGPCAGLTLGAFLESQDLHPVVTPITTAGAVFTTGSGLLALRAKGPCVDRLSFVQRTPTFINEKDVPYVLIHGEGVVGTQASARNQTGVVQLFLDCKGIVCSESGSPLATLTFRVRGSDAGAASATFPPAPSPLPTPTGAVITIPSVIGLSPEAAQRVLFAAGFRGVGMATTAGGTGSPLVIGQDPPAGAVVPADAADQLLLSGALPHVLAPSGPIVPSPPAATSPALSTTARIPTVVGMPVGQAEQVLKAAHIRYRLNYQTDARRSGTVLYQSPVAGTLVRPATEVELTVALDPRAVPSTTGTTLTPK